MEKRRATTGAKPDWYMEVSQRLDCVPNMHIVRHFVLKLLKKLINNAGSGRSRVIVVFKLVSADNVAFRDSPFLIDLECHADVSRGLSLISADRFVPANDVTAC